MKKLIPVLLAIFMLLGAQVTLGATATQISSTGVVVRPVTFYKTISGGQCKIVNNGNGTINISGSTSTYGSVKQIGLQLNLQYLSGGQWCVVDNYSYFKNNSSYVSGGQLIGVTKGYYRVFARHTSLNGSISESGQSYSEALYIQ